MKRDLFAFAGQSNMMGASVYPPVKPLSVAHSFEYKHKPRRLGNCTGSFVPAGYPVGEFSYADLARAYAPDTANKKGESTLSDYAENTYFCPAMSNLKCETDKTVHPFSIFSETTAPHGATLAPFLAEAWESKGHTCAYAHIAKGSVAFAHYMTDEMVQAYAQRITAYNNANATNYNTAISAKNRTPGAADYFLEKCKDFFADAETFFPGNLSGNRCFFWLQGESDAGLSVIEYKLRMEILWKKLKEIGFTHFFCIRVDFFGNSGIARIMQAQEQFVSEHPDAYMLTRIASYFPYADRDEQDWFLVPPAEECENCRDSFYGFENQHINEKGFQVIASHAVENLQRVLENGKSPILEKENIRSLLQES